MGSGTAAEAPAAGGGGGGGRRGAGATTSAGRWLRSIRQRLDANPVHSPDSTTTTSKNASHEKSEVDGSVPTTATGVMERARAPDDSTPDDDAEQDAAREYPTGLKLGLICLGLVMAVLCFALDETILSTAIPSIANHFNAIDDIGWYGSSFLFAVCACQLTYGKLYTILPVKWVFFSATLIFEVGNVVAGTAQSSSTVIGGRVITGIGCAGMNAGVFIIIANIVPVRKRPIYISSIGSMYSVAAVVGPIIGGSLAEGASWRWCFYINLPLGAIAMGCIVLFLDGKFLTHKEQKTLRDFWREFDLTGTVLFAGSILCLLLALQWGGVTNPWGSGRIVALLVVFGVGTLAFFGLMWHKQERALLPLRIARQRSVAAGWCWSFCAGAANVSLLFYMPIWFQAVKGASPTKSGLMVLPFLIGWILCAVGTGFLVARIGYVVPFMILGTVLMSVASGLFTTLKVASGAGMWIGYQILYSAGAGMGQNQPTTAIQAVLGQEDIATGTALVVFAQTLGAAIFVSVAQSIFIQQLGKRIAAAVPNFDASSLRSAGATDLASRFSAEQLPAVVQAYNGALTTAFYVAVGASVATLVGSLSMEWKNLRKADPDGDKSASKGEASDGSSDVEEGLGKGEAAGVDKEDEAEKKKEAGVVEEGAVASASSSSNSSSASDGSATPVDVVR